MVKKILGFVFAAVGILIALVLGLFLLKRLRGPQTLAGAGSEGGASGQSLLSQKLEQPQGGTPQASPPVLKPDPTLATIGAVAGTVAQLAPAITSIISAFSGGGGSASAGGSGWGMGEWGSSGSAASLSTGVMA